MTDYEKLLNTPEWKAKRKMIVARDKSTCTSCANKKLFDKALLGHVSHSRVSSEWITVYIVTSLEGNDHIIFIPAKDNQPIRSGTLVLVLPTNGKEEVNRAYLVARKPISDQDYKIDFLREYSSKEVEEHELQSYKQRLHNEWKHIKGLEVHHKYYQLGLMPWEYDDDALTTLCWYCHEALHKNGKVPVLDEYGNNIGEYTNCYRCHGAGGFPEFSHVQSGICFRCNGAKYEELIEGSI